MSNNFAEQQAATGTPRLDKDTLWTRQLEERGRQLAKNHSVSAQAGRRSWLTDRLQAEETLLTTAYQALASSALEEGVPSYAAEWLLDNFHVVQRTLRQIRQDIPKGYYRRLPKLNRSALGGYPRIYAVAVDIIQYGGGRLDLDRIERYVDAYQNVAVLTTGELWALPTMLRVGTLDCLTHAVCRVAQIPWSEGDGTPDAIELSPDLSDDDITANAILSLRMLANQDWKAFIERVSRVERILRTDPAQTYTRMDFETRDRYRDVVEDVAMRAGCNEVEAAQAAVRLPARVSTELRQTSPRLGHVGYYLIDKGRSELEDCLGCRLPWHTHIRRWLANRLTLVYLGSIGLLTLLILLALARYAYSAGATHLQLVVTGLLILLPAIQIATVLVNRAVIFFVPPHLLAKMDFAEGIPDDCRSMVVIPALLSSEQDVWALLRQLEQHYLGNPDPNLSFTLLADLADAAHKQMPGDAVLLKHVQAGIRALNNRYRRETPGPFYLFYRERRWNQSEGVWMGWERKRGKLTEFNRLLLDEEIASDIVHSGNQQDFKAIKYVITVDADTILSPGSAHRLVGTLAHPLNRAEFDSRSNRMIAGYTVLQPRIEVLPTSANRSLFTRVFAGGDIGLDLYTHAVSDVYQDLFGEGIFVGKGIYEVATFARSLQGRVPENTLLSHDLFEGIHGRAGLVSDIVAYEEYPLDYLVYMRRWQRWIRGDWQLLPWLLRRVPHEEGGSVSNSLSCINCWKVLDNLCRSLLAPALLALAVAGWIWLPGSPLLWTLSVLLALAIPAVIGLLAELTQRMQNMLWRRPAPTAKLQTFRWLLSLVFLPYEALVALDAILRTLIRLAVTHRHMLQWSTSADTARHYGQDPKKAVFSQQMGGATLIATFLTALVGSFRPGALPIAAPMLLAWFLSPMIGYWISRPARHEPAPLSADQRQGLRNLARRTWLYFEHFVGPEDHWLPPDHFQESPRQSIAHRTSPTNIGLMLLSTLAAYDLGYIGSLESAVRLQSAFESMDQLERHFGHFLNWYDTRTLEPLPPRYVSTVDSGNLAASLWALRQACLACAQAPVVHWRFWAGLLDTLAVLEETLEAQAKVADATIADLLERLDQIRARIHSTRAEPARGVALLYKLTEEGWPEIDRRFVTLIETHSHGLGTAAVHNLRIWLERVHHQLTRARNDVEEYMPWLSLLSRPPDLFGDPGIDSSLAAAWQTLVGVLPPETSLDQVPEICQSARARLAQLLERLDEEADGAALPMYKHQESIQEARQWCADLERKLTNAQAQARQTSILFRELGEKAEEYIQAMDFSPLYDPQRQLFHIGYHVDEEKSDANYYDLLASEARIASLVAIAKGEVPQSHWLHLGRPLTQVDGRRALLSWSGTMFEYLMPNLLVRQYENSLLAESTYAVVARQIAYARARHVPWGISESGYCAFDANLNHQYRAFGVPGLGFKRGLSEDLVVTPYASLLALPVQPQAVMRNLNQFVRMEMMGAFGLYEAVDFTRDRLALGQEQAIVHSFMVHHHGMILLSLTNFLCHDVMVDRFRADPRIRTVELLLQEQIPYTAPLEQPSAQEDPVVAVTRSQIDMKPWHAPVDAPFPQVHSLSNGRYCVLITSTSGGYSSWQDVDLTRWRADTTLDGCGTWITIQDQESGEVCPIGYPAGAGEAHTWHILFYPHKAEFQCEALHDVAANMEVAVAPQEDVEIRHITLTNQSMRRRRLSVTSYGEVILTPQDVDRRHPAFNKLFIESEYEPELKALIFHRRLRSADEAPIYLAHLLVCETEHRSGVEYESDRAQFLGRGRSGWPPLALDGGSGLTGTTGATLDPVFALSQEIELGPHESVQLAFLTMAASSRQEVLALARSFRNWAQIERCFGQAQFQSESELRQAGLSVPEVQRIQQLLSLLLYPHAALRADPAMLAANTQGQPRLWPYAISGDNPVLLVRIDSEEEIALVRELLRAHAYWRRRSLEIDLVVLNEKETGYAQELQVRLNQLLTRTKNNVWLNRRGGIFLLIAGQMSTADRVLLATAARVVLDAKEGLLDAQLARLGEQPTPLPRLFPTLHAAEATQPTVPIQRPVDLLFDNGFGGFSPDGREYVIYLRPDNWTPAPWCNVIANPRFGFLISEAGGGYTWAINSGENRLTPWNNDPVADLPGEALYLRDEETGQVWSPTPLPARASEPYLIRHGAGYTIFGHHSHGLKQRLRLFTDTDAPLKVVHVQLQNIWPRVRRITATYYAEWVLGVNRDTMQQFIVPEYESDCHALFVRNPYNTEFGERVAFVAANRELHGLTADRTEFLGRMGSMSRPAALTRIGLTGTVQPGLDPCAALQLHIDLEPGATVEFYFLVGQEANRNSASELIKRFLNPEEVDRAWERVSAFWDHLLGAITVQTPEPATNLLLNRWLQYQVLSCRMWGRSGFYQSSGAYGFRDQLQDSLALVHAEPEITREQILRAARHQFETGDVLHWWHPPSGRGVRTRISDDLLWLPYVTANYVRTTSDRSILTEITPFLAGKSLEADEHERYDLYQPSKEEDTLYEHCLRAIAKASTAGPHKLPLIGGGDWNDGMNRVGILGHGESIWLGWFLYAVLTNFASVCDMIGEQEQATVYRRQAGELCNALEENGWDGSWYRRAYYDNGSPLGSAQNDECQIDSIAQSWAVLSGAGDPQRRMWAMEAVYTRLVRLEDKLILLLIPPFDKTSHDPGYIKGYPPGVRENGGQYTHAALWAVWAFAELGQGDRAESLFRMLNPICHSDTPDKVMRYRAEPYVVAADIHGVHPHVGRAGWTWYTGSCGWMYRLGMEALLGLRREGDTLWIDPCIPKGWANYELNYRFGDTHYLIRVDNPDGVNRGTTHVMQDGNALPAGKIGLVDDGQEHHVQVMMG